MRLMHVEDQDDYKDELKGRLRRSIKIFPYIGLDADGNAFDLDAHQDGSKPIELQIERQIESHEASGGEIDLVLLDTDLSGLKNSISQSSIRTACSLLGIPVCRYSKRGLSTPQERLKYLATIAREGSQSILVPHEVLLGEQLSDWLIHVSESFGKIRKAIEKYSKDGIISPAELLAKIVKVPGIDIELMGYSGANFFFFGDLIANQERGGNAFDRHYSTQFGYWLCNYVLLFPGPILNVGATAAYLELTKSDIVNPQVSATLEGARYKGPFSKLGPYYVKQQLDNILVKLDYDSFADYFKEKGIEIQSPATESSGMPSYYCVVNDEPIAENNSKGPLDWMPRGAHMCRVKKETYDRFGPWLNV